MSLITEERNTRSLLDAISLISSDNGRTNVFRRKIEGNYTNNILWTTGASQRFAAKAPILGNYSKAHWTPITGFTLSV